MITATSTLYSTAQYVELLEKTNAQLSLWTNPYGVMVGILTLLVALLAIGSAYIILRQSSDYKQSFNKAVEGFLSEERKILRTKYDEAIEEEKKKIVSASKEEKKLLEERLKKLETQRAQLDVLPGNLTRFSGFQPMHSFTMSDSLTRNPWSSVDSVIWPSTFNGGSTTVNTVAGGGGGSAPNNATLQKEIDELKKEVSDLRKKGTK